jgi:hypothetical protein
VPSSLVWKWHDDILCTLPDYRVLVIGSKRKRITRGARKGLVTSETDTPEERAAKWVSFQTGEVDVVILSFDALGRTKMSQEAVVEYINSVEAVRRSISLRRRNLQDQKPDKLSERDRALLEHGVAAWVAETLKLPKGHQYDPGIAWDDIGIDLLMVDEAAAFKNLYMPQAREDGVPKFMGSSGEGSHRAWQLDFRAAAVRKPHRRLRHRAAVRDPREEQPARVLQHPPIHRPDAVHAQRHPRPRAVHRPLPSHRAPRRARRLLQRHREVRGRRLQKSRRPAGPDRRGGRLSHRQGRRPQAPAPDPQRSCQ